MGEAHQQTKCLAVESAVSSDMVVMVMMMGVDSLND